MEAPAIVRPHSPHMNVLPTLNHPQLMRLVGLGPRLFWRNTWNRLDAAVAVASCVSLGEWAGCPSGGMQPLLCCVSGARPDPSSACPCMALSTCGKCTHKLLTPCFVSWLQALSSFGPPCSVRWRCSARSGCCASCAWRACSRRTGTDEGLALTPKTLFFCHACCSHKLLLAATRWTVPA